MSETTQKPDSGLWRNNPETPEGKYLVLRRDGTVFDEPNFVLGPRDPCTPQALFAYARQASWRALNGDTRFNVQYAKDIAALARSISERQAEGLLDGGDPGKGRHREDHPLVIQQMREPDKRILAPRSTPATLQAAQDLFERRRATVQAYVDAEAPADALDALLREAIEALAGRRIDWSQQP